jgi:hypothetical protein
MWLKFTYDLAGSKAAGRNLSVHDQHPYGKESPFVGKGQSLSATESASKRKRAPSPFAPSLQTSNPKANVSTATAQVKQLMAVDIQNAGEKHTRPWRQNMKKPSAQPQPSTTASETRGVAAEGEALEPQVLGQGMITKRSKQLPAEEYAKLQEFMNRKKAEIAARLRDQREAEQLFLQRRRAAAKEAADKARQVCYPTSDF